MQNRLSDFDLYKLVTIEQNRDGDRPMCLALTGTDYANGFTSGEDLSSPLVMAFFNIARTREKELFGQVVIVDLSEHDITNNKNQIFILGEFADWMRDADLSDLNKETK